MALFMWVTCIPFSREVNFKESPIMRIDTVCVFSYMLVQQYKVMDITCGISKLISAVLKYLRCAMFIRNLTMWLL